MPVRKTSEKNFLSVREAGESITVSEVTPDSGYVIPLGGRLDVTSDPLLSMLYFDVMYPIAERGEKGKRKFHLIPPDPWMVMVAYIMLEGIIQGLTWDTAKATVKSALSKLRRHGLAPKKEGTAQGGRSRIGFVWAKYATDDEELHELFIGIQQAYAKPKRGRPKDVLSKKKKKAGPKKRPE
jgi:hypothetical protein